MVYNKAECALRRPTLPETRLCLASLPSAFPSNANITPSSIFSSSTTHKQTTFISIHYLPPLISSLISQPSQQNFPIYASTTFQLSCSQRVINPGRRRAERKGLGQIQRRTRRRFEEKEQPLRCISCLVLPLFCLGRRGSSPRRASRYEAYRNCGRPRALSGYTQQRSMDGQETSTRFPSLARCPFQTRVLDKIIILDETSAPVLRATTTQTVPPTS